MAADQTVHLELYAPNVKAAFARAQALADARRNAVVTVHHLVSVMLEAKWGHGACVAAGVAPERVLAEAEAAMNALPDDAKDLSYLDARVLNVMARAERLREILTRELVDFECIYKALGEHKVCSPAIGATTWSPQERLGVVPGPSATPSLETALFLSGKVLDGLGDEIAAATGRVRAPAEVVRTLQKVRARLLPPNSVPELEVDWTSATQLVLTRENVACEVGLEWSPPAAIHLVVRRGDANVTTVFLLVTETNEWRSSDSELFASVRRAIVGLYPEIDGKVKP
jgi:hypothetical protein